MKSGRETFHEHYSNSIKPEKPEAEVDMEMRGRIMSGDPMAAFFREKEREKQGAKGTPIYKGQYPPNRFNIRPGHRWDGVDRSNGHEKKLIDQQSAKKASEEDSYRHATRDL